MTRAPSYPEDAPVGAPAEPEAESDGEAVAAAKAAAGSRRTRNLVAGAAIGVGSAALVAALLYATRSRKGDEEPK